LKGIAVQFGNAPCSWGINYPTGNAVGWREYLDEVAAAGYRGTELGPFGYLPKDPDLVRRALSARGLELLGATHVHTFGDTATTVQLMATLAELCPLLVRLGARHLVIMDEDNWYPAEAPGRLDTVGWRGLTAAVRQAQAIIEGEFGLKASFHPHVGTAVEREAQIDRLLADTEIGLCLDTGHHAFWNQDPVAYMSKVWDRIAYVHLKNVDAAIRQQVLDRQLTPKQAFAAGVMCPLPDGVVDIRAVVALIEAHSFSGPVVVEQDPAQNATETPLTLARRNLQFLRRA
jgi:inosose dehydratase